MLELEANGKYADVMERAFYNGTISGMQADGKRFFYVNPLEVNPGISGVVPGYKHVLPERPGWYACACCPPNLVRLITSLGKYVWDETDDTIFFHMFVGQKAELEKADIDVESSYPWEGKVTYHVHSKKEEEYTLAIHIPGYLKDICVKVNGEQIEWKKFMKNGYLYLTRKWGESQVEILFDLEVRKVYANKNVREDGGKGCFDERTVCILF